MIEPAMAPPPLTSDIFSRNPLTYKDLVRKMGHYIPAAGRNVRPPEAGYCGRGAPLGLRGGAYLNGTRFHASQPSRSRISSVSAASATSGGGRGCTASHAAAAPAGSPD